MDPFRRDIASAINAILPPARDRIIFFSERTPTTLTTNARKEDRREERESTVLNLPKKTCCKYERVKTSSGISHENME